VEPVVLAFVYCVAWLQVIHFDVGEEREITVLFDAAHGGDSFHSCTVDDNLTITYQEHPHVVSLPRDSVTLLSVVLLSIIFNSYTSNRNVRL